MLTLRFGPESYIDLPSGDAVQVVGDQLLVRDAKGSLVANADRLSVLAFGRNEILRAHHAPKRDGKDAFQRYEHARQRFLMLEEEFHQLLREAKQDPDLRSQLASMAAQLDRVLDTEVVPLRDGAIDAMSAAEPHAVPRPPVGSNGSKTPPASTKPGTFPGVITRRS